MDGWSHSFRIIFRISTVVVETKHLPRSLCELRPAVGRAEFRSRHSKTLLIFLSKITLNSDEIWAGRRSRTLLGPERDGCVDGCSNGDSGVRRNDRKLTFRIPPVVSLVFV